MGTALEQAWTRRTMTRLPKVVSRLHRVAEVPVVYAGVVASGRVLRLGVLNGVETTSLHGLTLLVGRGLGGRAIALGRPTVVSDYVHSEAISHHYDEPVRAEGVRAAIAVPVVVAGVPRAVIFAARREPALVSDRAIGATIAAARELEQQLVVEEEVERRLGLVRELASSHHQPAPAGEGVREAYAELRKIAAQTADPAVRASIELASEALERTWRVEEEPDIVLAPRELDVLALVALGLTNAQIAAELALQPETVKSYLRSAMRRLDAHTRMQAVTAARTAGVLP